jgi:hypothetical protein
VLCEEAIAIMCFRRRFGILGTSNEPRLGRTSFRLAIKSREIKFVFLYFNRINILDRNLVYLNIDTAE